MMEFVILTLGVTVGVMLSTGLTVLIVMNPKVMTWYMKRVQKVTNIVVESMFENEDEEL